MHKAYTHFVSVTIAIPSNSPDKPLPKTILDAMSALAQNKISPLVLDEMSELIGTAANLAAEVEDDE